MAAEATPASGRLVIDLRGGERCQRHDVRICLIGCTPTVQRILDISELDLDTYPGIGSTDAVVPMNPS